MRRTIVYPDRSYVIAPDDDPPVGARMTAIVGARVLDELTGEPPRSELTISTTTAGLAPRVTEDGIVGLAGIPTEVFSLLAGQPYGVDIVISAEGFVRHAQNVPIAAQGTFPTTFAFAPLADIALHR